MKLSAKKNPLLFGTAILTGAGLLSRLIGFLYRIFLSRTIGASSLGLYQLAFSVLTICYAISFEGVMTAISKFVAEAAAKDSAERRRTSTGLFYLFAGLFLSIVLSLLLSALLYGASDAAALYLLNDTRCGVLLRILAYTILPASIASCINGYYYGRKKTTVPAISQLIGQLARVGSVAVMYLVASEKGIELTAVHAVWGALIGEVAGMLFGAAAMSLSVRMKEHHALRLFTSSELSALFFMALPLTANHALMHLIGGIENLLIPQKLISYGLSSEDALSLFGVFSGMVMPILFFPGVLTNSLAVLLLPSVSNASARGDTKKTDRIISSSIRYGLLFGFVFMVIFLVFGETIGTILFDSALAGTLIQKLAFLCPMLYVYSLLSSILHGLGHAGSVLTINLLASLIRIGAICFLVPSFGLSALLWGMLISQLFAALAAMILVSL